MSRGRGSVRLARCASFLLSGDLGGADSLVPVVIEEGTITLPIGYTVGVATRLP